MTLRGPRSLQGRLVIRLAALFIAGMVAIAAFLVWRAYDTADSLAERELSLRADDLAAHVVPGPDGSARLALPESLQRAYDDPSGSNVFVVRTRDGRLVAAQPAEFGRLAKRWPATGEDASYFRLADIPGHGHDYYGLGVTVESAAGPLSIWVARAGGANALVHSFLEEFVFDIAWVIPLFLLLTLAIAVLAIRSTLRPIRQVSEVAASIGPGTTSTRLPVKGLPTEIAPLVAAVNQALARLEQGFAVQREFTANAAHELRTPLTIVTGALDEMETTPDIVKVRADVARMNRLVAQLLSVARLDAIALDVASAVDLDGAARDVVASLAPWTLAQKRSIAFVGAGRPVVVKGNPHAIADAIRNLVENAVTYSPASSQVTVETSTNGAVRIVDQGPGVAMADREHIFERFWRGRAAAGPGAGLGLAIVAEIMKAHGGRVAVNGGASGGSVFTLTFPSAA